MNSATLLDNFDLLAEAPGGVPKLRELILQLAVRGTLVPQEKGSGKGKIHHEEHEEHEGRSEKDGRRQVSLRNVATRIHYGYTASANPSITAVRLLRITDIQDNHVNWDSVPGCEIEDKDVPKYELHPGDILIARTGGTIGKTYLISETPVRAVFASYLIRVVPSNRTFPRFLKLFLESPDYWEQLRLKSAGTGQPNVNGQALGSLELDLPPLPEQKRIVARVDELMNRCDELESRQKERNARHTVLVSSCLHALTAPTSSLSLHPSSFSTILQPSSFNLLATTPASVAELRKTILQLAVQGRLVPQDEKDEAAETLMERVSKERKDNANATRGTVPVGLPAVQPDEEPYDLPAGWQWVRLGSCVHYSDAGCSPHCERRPRIQDEWGVLKVSAVTWGQFNPAENKALPATLAVREECEVKDGDFLITRANTADLVARSVVVRNPPPRLLLSDKIVRLAIVDCLDRDFLNLANNSDASRSYYARHASGTSSSMRNVTRDCIHALPVPLPPPAEQKRIVAIALCDALNARLTQSRADADTLAAAVVHHVCNGGRSGFDAVDRKALP